MKITKESLQKIAHLARIEIDEAHEEELKKDLEQIVTWVEKLDELNLEEIDALIKSDLSLDTLREDKADDSFSPDQALKNAPMKKDRQFEVPNIMKKK